MAIQLKEDKFVSADKKSDIYYTCWYDDSRKPKAVLQLVHGMAEYIARYDDFARYMVQNGYIVYGDDHLGHGRTAKATDSYGYIADKGGERKLVEDVHTLSLIAKQDNPGLPFILLGHSMGSFIARYFAALYPTEADGFIFMGTSGSNPAAGAGIAMINVMKLFRGGHFRSKFIDKLGSGGYYKKIPEVRTAFDWLSVNEQNVEKYIADEECGFLFTISAYKDLMKLLQFVSTDEWYRSLSADVPVLLISGADDPVGQYSKGVQEVCDKLKNAGVKDLSIKLYDGLRHEILNEKENRTVYGDVLAWCDGAIKK